MERINKYFKGGIKMEIDDLLQEQIKGGLEGLGNITMGSEEYKTAVDGITKLVDREIELKKLDSASDDKRHQRLLEIKDRELDRARHESEEKDRLIKNGLTAAGIIIPTIVTIWGTFKSFQFEKEGSITTIMGRGFINKLLPKK